MQTFIKNTDQLAGIGRENGIATWFERIAFFFLFVMVIAAPHSIAASQAAYILGILFTATRFIFKPRPKLIRTALDWLLLGTFGCAVIISVFAYDPLVSAGKLRGVSLFLIFYFVINNLRNLRALRLLVFAMIFSCMINVLWTPIQRFIGRGVEIHGISAESPLKKVLLWEGDTILSANGKKITAPEELVYQIENSEVTNVLFYRPDFEFSVNINRSDLLTGDSLQKLGIESWKKSRNWRSKGFFGHYVTYAEVLQLIGSFAFGLFVASIGSAWRKFRFSFSPVLLFCVAAIAVALLLTVTRSSQLAFLIASLATVIVNGNRKLVLSVLAIALPLAMIGLFFLQQSREVGFFDNTDESVNYRQTVYREGLELWTENPKHFFLGVGMDMVTKKDFVEKWGLFDNGKLPVGHFHSTPIQLLVERGVFGLILWLCVLGIYFRILWRSLKFENAGIKGNEPFQEPSTKLFSVFRVPLLSLSQTRRGVILGCIGASVGFFTSGFAQYNLGDGEVAMVFYLLMGFGVFAANTKVTESE